MTLHFIHVRKTGGTAIKRALRKAGVAYWHERDAHDGPQTRHGRIQLHHHSFRAAHVDAGDAIFFCLRDPIDRFMSGFYSRLNKGQPRYYQEWTQKEAIIFDAFPTPQALAAALASDDGDQRRLARWSMFNILHLRPMEWYVGTPSELRGRRRHVLYVARQETLDADWQGIKSVLGLPPELELPSDPKRAHRRDPAVVDKTLDEPARAALRDWYRRDYRLLRYCDQLRAWNGWGGPPRRLHGLPALVPAPPLAVRERLRLASRFRPRPVAGPVGDEPPVQLAGELPPRRVPGGKLRD